MSRATRSNPTLMEKGSGKNDEQLVNSFAGSPHQQETEEGSATQRRTGWRNGAGLLLKLAIGGALGGVLASDAELLSELASFLRTDSIVFVAWWIGW